MRATKREIPIVRPERTMVRIRRPGHRLDGEFGEMLTGSTDGKAYVRTRGNREYVCLTPDQFEMVR